MLRREWSNKLISIHQTCHRRLGNYSWSWERCNQWEFCGTRLVTELLALLRQMPQSLSAPLLLFGSLTMLYEIEYQISFISQIWFSDNSSSYFDGSLNGLFSGLLCLLISSRRVTGQKIQHTHGLAGWRTKHSWLTPITGPITFVNHVNFKPKAVSVNQLNNCTWKAWMQT